MEENKVGKWDGRNGRGPAEAKREENRMDEEDEESSSLCVCVCVTSEVRGRR